MTIKAVVFRYLVAYLALFFGLTIVLSILGIQANLLVIAGLLFGAAYWPCLAFGKQTQRYFSRREKVNLIVNMSFIDLLGQIVVGNVMLPGTASLGEVVMSFILVLWAHAAFLTLIVQGVGWQLKRQGITALPQAAAKV